MPFLHLNALSEHLVALSGAQSADFTVRGQKLKIFQEQEEIFVLKTAKCGTKKKRGGGKRP